MAQTKLQQPLKFHGGKFYEAARFHDLEPKNSAGFSGYVHRVITHGGGLGEFWNWHHTGISEVVNDINGVLSNFWAVLQNEKMFAKFKRRVDVTPFSKPEYEAAVRAVAPVVTQHRFTGESCLDLAVQFFVYCRQSMSGRMDSFTPLSRTRTRRDMNEQASAWLTSIEGLPSVHCRLRPVVIYNEDAEVVIDREDTKDTLFFLDPTYLDETRTVPNVYDFEMTPAQHESLLKKLVKIKGRFMLCGYRSKLYDRLLPKSKFRCDEHHVVNHSGKGATKQARVECLWMNY